MELREGFLVTKIDVGVADLDEGEYPGGGAVCAITVHFELLGSDIGPDEAPPQGSTLIIHRVLLPSLITQLKKAEQFLEDEDRDPAAVPLDLPWSDDIDALNRAVVNEIKDKDVTDEY